MTSPLTAFDNRYVFSRGSSLQLTRTGLAGTFFPSSQVFSICGRIRLHDLNFERILWHEGLPLSTYFGHAFESGKLWAHNQGLPLVQLKSLHHSGNHTVRTRVIGVQVRSHTQVIR